MSNDTNDFRKFILLNSNHEFMIKTSTTNYNTSFINETEFSQLGLNVSTNAQTNSSEAKINAVISVIYVIIFISGVLGNVITCVVISRNRSMHTGKNSSWFKVF